MASLPGTYRTLIPERHRTDIHQVMHTSMLTLCRLMNFGPLSNTICIVRIYITHIQRVVYITITMYIYILEQLYFAIWGTGMIASSSTFRPHPGRVIRDLFRLLDAVTALYGSTSLQQSSKGSCSLLVSGYNLRADCQWRTLVPPLNSGANAAPASVLALM